MRYVGMYFYVKKILILFIRFAFFLYLVSRFYVIIKGYFDLLKFPIKMLFVDGC